MRTKNAQAEQGLCQEIRRKISMGHLVTNIKKSDDWEKPLTRKKREKRKKIV